VTYKIKILISICVIFVLSILLLICYNQYNLTQQQKRIETEIVKQKDLAGNITRSMNEYATKKDIESYIQNNNLNLKAIQDDMKLLSAEISAVNDYTVDSIGYHKTNISSTHIGETNPDPKIPTVECNGQQIPCPNTDSFGYLKNQQMLTLYEPFVNVNVPIGEVGFSAWQQKPWEVKILPRTYHMTSVVGTDENQRQYFYNKVSVSVEGKTYDVKISTATTKQEYPEASFNWWNPRLFMGIDGGLNLSQMSGEASPNLDVGFMSYGRFKNQPDFSFLQLGLGFGIDNKKIQFVVTPFTYNVGKHIPLMNNVYVGPSLYIGSNGDISIMGGLRTAL
jgi:hypothetical protein